MDYETVIGLEIHSELATNSKMFCSCKNDPEEKSPNINICPVCMGHPGTLPVANREAIKKVLQVGVALGSELPKYGQFDRKNYFYPDIPKGYQISQYENPLVVGGKIKLSTGKEVHITRVHLEEDTASNMHDELGNTLVDFNRAGIPLMELVTEPDLRTAAEAKEAAEELQLIYKYADASHARMQLGEMRVEANISIMPKGSKKFGTKVELKNINSFKAVEKAIEFEVKRQIEILESGEEITQQTRGWDENKGVTFTQRLKESAHDYRYFPEPDLPPLHTAIFKKEIVGSLPELPAQKRERLISEYGLDQEATQFFVKDEAMANFFENATSELAEWLSSSGHDTKSAFKLVRNYLMNDLPRALDEKGIKFDEMQADPENFAELITLVAEKKISSRGAKDILAHMVEHGGDPSEHAREMELLQTSDTGALESIVTGVIEGNESAVAEYKKGKGGALQYLVGQSMKASKGRGNPEALKKLLEKSLRKA